MNFIEGFIVLIAMMMAYSLLEKYLDYKFKDKNEN